MHARGTWVEQLLSSYRAEANLDGLNSYRESIEHPETSSMDREAIKNAIKRS